MDNLLLKIWVLDSQPLVVLWSVQDCASKITKNTSIVESSLNGKRDYFIPLLFRQLGGNHLIEGMKEVLKQFKQDVLSH